MPFILTIKAEIVSESSMFLDHCTPCYNPDDNNSHCHSHGRLFVDKLTLSCKSRNFVMVNVHLHSQKSCHH
jgi:hypothetical protein